MSYGIRLRTVPALITAYALALQVVLLAFACPFVGGSVFAAQLICSHAGGSAPAPSPPCCDGLGVCLAGCCTAPALRAAATAVLSPRESARPISAPLNLSRPYDPSAFAAHRSRAPPLG